MSTRPAIHTLLLAAALVASGCRRTAPEKPAVAVRAQMVAPKAAGATASFSGTVAALTQVDVSFKVGGYVDKIGAARDAHGRPRPIQVGSAVEAGAELAALRQADFRAKVLELRGMQRAASADFAQAKLDLDRARKLVGEGVIAQAEYDALRARQAASSGAATAAAARADQAGIAFGDSKLRSPIDGVVLARAVEVGTLVAPGAPVFVIADVSKMRIVFGVPDSVQRSLSLDQPVTVTTGAVPGRVFVGSISKIAARADAMTRVFEVEATVDNSDGALKVGMVSTVELARDSDAPPAVVVPLASVVRPPGQASGYAVFLADSAEATGNARLQAVSLGDLTEAGVVVSSGLRPGDRLIVQGAALLADGQRIRVIPDALR